MIKTNAETILSRIIKTKVGKALNEAIKMEEIDEINTLIFRLKETINSVDGWYSEWYYDNFSYILDLAHKKTMISSPVGYYFDSAKVTFQEKANNMLKMCFEDNLNKNDINKFVQDFELQVHHHHNQESLSCMIAKDVADNLLKPIMRSANQNFNIKTSSFSFYSAPPMGMNEFVLKAVMNDIFELSKIEPTGRMLKGKDRIGVDWRGLEWNGRERRGLERNGLHKINHSEKKNETN